MRAENSIEAGDFPRGSMRMNGRTVQRSETALDQAVAEKPRPIETPSVTPPKPPPSKGKFLWLGTGVVAALVAVVWVISSARKSASSSAALQVAPSTAVIERRDFVRLLRLTGTTQAVEAHAVLAPRIAGQQFGSLVVTKLVPAGTRVKKGDLLVEFDRQNEIKTFLDKQAEFRDLEDQIAKKRADAEKHRETLEETKATYQQLRQTYDLKRKAAGAEIRDLEIQRDRARETMEHAQRNEEEMAILSPMDGVAVLNTIWKNGRMGEVQVGEEIRPGVPFMQVIDPNAMIVRVEVNQADLLDLKMGMKAQVHLDAYPGMVFPATFEELDSIGHSGRFSDTVRDFDAVFSIQGSDPR